MKLRTPLVLLASVALSIACGSGSGGGAGDILNNSGENTAGPSLLESFVGTWQLTDGWSTNTPDEALLVVRTPANNLGSEVVLYDFTDEASVNAQCFREPFGNGEAFDSATSQVFIDFSEFQDGILSLNGENTMIIEFTDANDVNANNDTTERVSTTLTRVLLVESDISPICSS